MTTEIPQVVEINCETGEEVYRPMTQEELDAREVARIAWEEAKLAQDAAAEALAALKASAKAKLIAGQPLTAEEADTLII